MMTYFLLVISIILIITGIVASFVPIIPGPITGWFGLFALSLLTTFIAETPKVIDAHNLILADMNRENRIEKKRIRILKKLRLKKNYYKVKVAKQV